MKHLRIATLVCLASLVASPLLAQTPQTGGSSSSMKPAASAPATPKAAATPAAKMPLLDINSASKADLDALPGIGAARSEAIIKGRPYKGKDDLLSRKILPANVYNGIKDRIIAKQS